MLFVVVPSSFLGTDQLKSVGGSKDESLLAVLIVSREASEPSIWREDRNVVLFFLIREKTLSSPAFQCGRTRIAREFPLLESVRSQYEGNME